MLSHQRHPRGNALVKTYMDREFRSPKDFASFLYLSQVLQARVIQFGAEAHRRKMPFNMGSLYWQLDDCWPVASWSSLDYFGRWKALHYAARRFYAPVMLSIEDNPPEQALHVTSDLCEPCEGQIRWSLETLGGKVLASGEEQVKAAPLSSAHVRTLNFADQVCDDNRREAVFVAELWQGEQRMALQMAAFVPTKHLSLADPAIAATVRNEADHLAVDLQSGSAARLVELSLEGADVIFSDNYFDLPAGRQVTITCPVPGNWTLEHARSALKVRSVYDSYAH